MSKRGLIRRVFMISSGIAVLLLTTGAVLRTMALDAVRIRAVSVAEQRLALSRYLRPWDSELLLWQTKLARWSGQRELWQTRWKRGSESGSLQDAWKLEAQLAQVAEGRQRLDINQCRALMSGEGEPSDIAEAFITGFTRQRDYESALTVVDAWRADEPQSVQPQYLTGVIAITAQERSTARKHWEEVLQREPYHELARKSLVDVLVAEDQLEFALNAAHRWYELSNGNTSARLAVARCLRLLGQTDAASQVIESAPESSEARAWRLERGHLALEQGQYAVAAQCLDDADSDDDVDPDELERCAVAYHLAGQLERATTLVTRAREARAATQRQRTNALRSRLN